jgi:hypothetical protein
VVELPWAAGCSPCVEKLRAVLPLTVGIRDSAMQRGWVVESEEGNTLREAGFGVLVLAAQACVVRGLQVSDGSQTSQPKARQAPHI